ncbi:potassium transporter Kup [Nevskia sp.]|uniref:potassium transporter Kup n=1 Tax=Nevskia sp. TaxID=1929292 RepID=UPI0025E82E2C|nr:potassium transporter Kup [Nevskia sp.]
MRGDRKTLSLGIAALGVVYGDIGTSPIYALRECFFGEHSIEASSANVHGVLSLITWALILIVTLKYLAIVMRADNRGEGGTIALVALLNPWRSRPGSTRNILMMVGLFGAALLYGDGAITPAISVLSALEGLKVATPAFQPIILPLTVIILIGIFFMQKRGTGDIGALFGPGMAIWFATLGALGIAGIIGNPGVLKAINPLYALHFFTDNGFAAFIILSSVFLVVTGAEALYADMGHFGRSPIRRAWGCLVLPALLLNYFGQGALILGNPDVHNPFYQLAPGWMTYPLVALTTFATIIASQAMITGAFSLTRQLVQLGQLPRMNIVQTSGEEQGQIYIPAVNWLLMLACITLVLVFRSSSNLAAAYGIAVSSTMVVTTILTFFVARRYDWPRRIVYPLAALFLVIDLGFFSANLFKIADGGWVPLMMAALIFTLMTTWSRGRKLFHLRIATAEDTTDELARRVREDPPHKIPGTGVYMTGDDHAPAYLLRHLERNRVLHERIVLLTVQTVDEPRVPAVERLRGYGIAPGIYRLVIRYGFMQTPNVPVALRFSEQLGLDIDIDNVTYFLGRATLIPSDDLPGMPLWRDHLFAFLAHNATRATDFYGLPPEDVVELGFHVEI